MRHTHRKGWLGLTAAGLMACGNCAKHPTTPPVSEAVDPATPDEVGPADVEGRSRSEPLAHLLALNEGMSVPAPLVRRRRVSLAQQTAELRVDATLARALGATAVRANCHTYPYLNHQAVQRDPDASQRMADAYMKAVQDAGLSTVMVLAPWPCIQTANYTDRYLPDDLDRYADFIQRTVERYDADGVDDMPGLERPLVLGWEIDNEPDLHNAVPPRDAKRSIDPGSFQTPTEYAEIVRVTSAAIRAADPEATVLLGGMYNPRSPSGRAYLDAVLQSPGVRDAFDVFSVHCYKDDNSLDAIEETIAIADALLPDRPVWITEVGVTSQGQRSWQDADWQAHMVVGLHGAALAGGVERVFWHTLSDPPPAPNRRTLPFSHHSLSQTVTSTWDDPRGQGERVRKPSGEAYARLAARLAESGTAAVTAVSSSTGKSVLVGDHVLVYWGSQTLTAGQWEVEDLMTGVRRTASAGTMVDAPAWAVPLP